MFKRGSVSDELYRSMETGLVKNQTENNHGLNKLAKAVDFLSTAAEIFEQAGMKQEADEIIEILNGLTEDVK